MVMFEICSNYRNAFAMIHLEPFLNLTAISENYKLQGSLSPPTLQWRGVFQTITCGTKVAVSLSILVPRRKPNPQASQAKKTPA